MAVRAGPSREHPQVATVAAGSEYHAVGRCGDYLAIRLEIDSVPTTAYVTHTIGETVLLVPAEAPCSSPAPMLHPCSSPAPAPAARAAAAAAAAAEAATAAAAAEAATGCRVAALEAKVAAQDQVIQALQAEMGQLRAQLSAIAKTFQPLC